MHACITASNCRNKAFSLLWPASVQSLGKIKFRTFPKSVGPQIQSLERVDYSGTREHY